MLAPEFDRIRQAQYGMFIVRYVCSTCNESSSEIPRRWYHRHKAIRHQAESGHVVWEI